MFVYLLSLLIPFFALLGGVYHLPDNVPGKKFPKKFVSELGTRKSERYQNGWKWILQASGASYCASLSAARKDKDKKQKKTKKLGSIFLIEYVWPENRILREISS